MTTSFACPRTESVHYRLYEFARTALIKSFASPNASVCDLYCGGGVKSDNWDEPQIGHYIGIGRRWGFWGEIDGNTGIFRAFEGGLCVSDPVKFLPVDPPIAATAPAAVEDRGNAAGEIGPPAKTISGGVMPILCDRPRSSFTSWSANQKLNQSLSTASPWCKLLLQYSQNPNVSICADVFTIGSSKSCNFSLREQLVSPSLCKIKQTMRDGRAVAALEGTGSKGPVQVNGKIVKKGSSVVLNSGDEVVLRFSGNHAYIFMQLSENTMPSSAGVVETKSSAGKALYLARRSGDPSAVAGASILAILSSLRPTMLPLNPPAHNSPGIHRGSEIPSFPDF